MRKPVWLAWLLLLALASFACDEDPAGPTDSDPGPGLVGTVVDAAGAPVGGAPVGLIYGLPPEYDPFGWPPAESPTEVDCALPSGLHVRFSLEAPSRVTLRLLDHRDRVVHTLLVGESLLPAGTHEFSCARTKDAGELLPAGAYHFRIEITRPGFSDSQESGAFLLNTLSIDYENCLGPATVTDSEGRFRIAYADLPIGADVRCGYQETCVVPDSLWIQAVTPTGRARQFLRLPDLEIDQELTLTLELAP